MDNLPDEAQAFLRLLDPQAQGFTYQTFEDRASDAPITKPKLALVHFDAAKLHAFHAAGAGVYVTVNETDGTGRKIENMIRVRAVWQEADDGYAGPFPLEPSIVVESSPGRHHRYWLVADGWPADEQGKADFAAVMQRMVATYGSCPHAKDIARVLRVPGFLHRKGDAFLVRTVAAPGHRYSRDAILQAFQPVTRKIAQLAQRRRSIFPNSTGAGDRVAGVIRAIANAREGERNDLTFWGACRLAEMVAEGVLTHDDAIDIAIEAASRAGLPANEAKRTAQSAFENQFRKTP